MTTIAIVGPGAVGGTFAAHLCQVGTHRVTVCARTPFGRLQVETPDGSVTASPDVLVAPARARPVDWVLIAVKAYDAASCASWLGALVSASTSVAVLQNGVEHVERFAPWVDPVQLVPVVVDCPAERLSPGQVRQRRRATCVVPDTEPGRGFVDLLARTPVDVETAVDWTTAAWQKLCGNSVGAVSALLLQPATVAGRDGVAELMRGLVRECIAVGRAEGATLDDDLPDQLVERSRRASVDSVNSLHADRLAGRPLETDARNGAVVRKGRAHGIPTPLNAAMVALLDAASTEDRRRSAASGLRG